MKKLIPLMALALVILVGCAKEETTTAALSTADQQVDESSVYVFNTNGESSVWEAVSLEDVQSNSAPDASTRSNSAHAHGNYHAPSQFATISFSGTQNNGGTHGSADFLQELPFGNLSLILDTECVIVEGDEAIYGGVITEVLESFFPPGFDLTGWYIYFKVKDNGQGNNAQTYQYFQNLILTPGPFVNCAAGISWGELEDVGEEDDKIKVN